MRRAGRAPSGGPAGGKVDARSERWREHRKKVRAEIVDAAFRALDAHGPNVSLREIAEEAGTAKPKIYRHFTDKADLFSAIGHRMRDMLWAAIFPAIDIEADAAREVIGTCVEEYVRLVDRHPDVIRFLLLGRFTDQAESAKRTLDEGRDITLGIAALFNQELRELHMDPTALEMAAHAMFGAAASATEWWLGAETDSPRRMPHAAFVSHLSTIMFGAVSGVAGLLGVTVDAERPIHEAVGSARPVA